MVIENDCLFTQRTIKVLNATYLQSILLIDWCLPIKMFAVYTWEKFHTDYVIPTGKTLA